MMFIRRQTDHNHSEIARELRKVTFVLDVHGLGEAGCDLIAKNVATQQPMFIEIKNPKVDLNQRRLTENERKMQTAFPGNYRVVLTVDDALAAVGVARPLPMLQDVFREADLSTIAPGAKYTKPTSEKWVLDSVIGGGGPLSPLARRAKRRG